MQDKHCQNYRISVSRKKIVYIPTGTFSQERRKLRTMGSGVGSLKSLHPSSPFEELVHIWADKTVPVEQQSAFLAVIESLTDTVKAKVMAEETDLVRKDKSAAQHVNRIVLVREQHLSHLTSLAHQDEPNPKEAADALLRIRHLSIQAVKAIKTWREELHALNSTNHRILKLPYIWNRQDYLLKIRNDLNFLVESNLAHSFEFSRRSDPFLIHPTLAYHQTKLKLDLPIASGLQNEIKTCEAVILDEILNGKEMALNKGSLPSAEVRSHSDYRSSTQGD
jgi:hypothetical protein